MEKVRSKENSKKILDLFSELREHPTTRTGQVEQLKGNLSGFWSRRIDKGSRMIYAIENEKVVVTVVSPERALWRQISFLIINHLLECV